MPISSLMRTQHYSAGSRETTRRTTTSGPIRSRGCSWLLRRATYPRQFGGGHALHGARSVAQETGGDCLRYQEDLAHRLALLECRLRFGCLCQWILAPDVDFELTARDPCKNVA